MILDRFGNFLINVDNFLDYVPLASTVSNLVDLFQKFSYASPARSVKGEGFHDPAVEKGAYRIHLEEKKTARCLWLLIPGFGNLVVAIQDFANRKGAYVLSRLDSEGVEVLERASKQLKDDDRFMLQAIKRDSRAFKWASKRLREDGAFVIGVLCAERQKRMQEARRQGTACVPDEAEIPLQLGPDLLDNPSFVLAAARFNSWILLFASTRLCHDGPFMFQAMREWGAGVLGLASEELKNDPYFMLAAIEQVPLAAHYQGNQLKQNGPFQQRVAELQRLHFYRCLLSGYS